MERTEQLADDLLGWDRNVKQLWEGLWLRPCLTKRAQAKHKQISSKSQLLPSSTLLESGLYTQL